MRLFRFGDAGQERPGAVLPDGDRIDCNALGEDWNEQFFGSGGLSRLATWLETEGSRAPRVASGVRIGPPVARPSKIVCIGLNYRDHAAETGAELPAEPVIFFKATTAIVGPDDDHRDRLHEARNSLQLHRTRQGPHTLCRWIHPRQLSWPRAGEVR